MNSNFPKDPVIARPIIEHLSMWGELASCEERLFASSTRWLSILVDSGIIDEIKADDGSTLAWALSTKGWILLDTEPNTAARLALFQVPEYRAYLTGILVEGLALAAKMDMRDQLENWTDDNLLTLLEEINLSLDSVERKRGRLIDCRIKEIKKRCTGLPGRDRDFSIWDQVLLGRTGRPDELFDFVLKRFSPFATIAKEPLGIRLPALLRYLPLTEENGRPTTKVIVPEAWNIQRKHIQTSLALFDVTGKPFRSLQEPKSIQEAVQNALLDQPFYKAVVHLATIAWRSPAANIPAAELRLASGSDLADARVILGGQDVGELRDLLSRLLHVQGVHPSGLENGSVRRDLMENLLQNLISFEVLHLINDEIQLHPEFQASLMANRLRTVFRPGKQLQRLMVDELQRLLNQKEQERANGAQKS